MKDHNPQDPDPAKAAYYAERVHPSPSPQLTKSSVNSKDRVTVPVQHDAVHFEVAILVKVSVVQMIRVGRKETNVFRNRLIRLAKGVRTFFRLKQGYN